jgi:hypothetical protein
LKTIGLLLNWLGVFCLTACDLPFASPPVTTTPSFTPIPTFTASPRPSATATPTHPRTPTRTATPTPFEPFTAVVWADNVNLRTNPGYLFDIRASLRENTEVLVLGRSLGDEWIYVRLPSGTEGWVFAQFLDAPIDLTDAPFIESGPIQLVAGRVLNEAEEPVSGVHFALVKGAGDDAPRTDATTGPDGMFYAFLPLNADGEWDIYFTAIACTSNTMDQDCNCLGGVCGQPYPSDVTITLPLGEPLYFVWK